MEKTFKFRGFKSGDYESFCFAVPKDDCMRIVPEDEHEYLDENPFHNNCYNLYPDDLMQYLESGKEYEFEITIKTKEVK